MAFKDLDDFLVIKPLVLPIRGKEYAFPGEISARAGLLLQRAFDVPDDADPDAVVLTDAEENELRTALFGGLEKQMIDDGLTNTHLRVVFYTLIAYQQTRDLKLAEQVWNAQGEAIAPNRETRRRKPAAKSTRPRGSRAASTAPKDKAPESPGPSSSDTGTSSKPT